MSDHGERYRASPELAIEKPRVISLSLNPDLLWLREALLKQAGFDVVSTIDPEQALLTIQAAGFDLLLLCFSLSDSIQERVARQFQQSRPGKRIIAVGSQKDGSSPPAYADIFLNGEDGPDALMAALQAIRLTPRS